MNIIEITESFINTLDSSDIYTKVIAGIIVAILTGMFAILVRRIKLIFTLKKWRTNEISNKIIEVADQEQLNLIKSHLYVPAMGQLEAPNDFELLEASQNRFPLVNAIMDELYSKKSFIDKKRYLILSGSGMGKTAFTASLLFRHINRYKYKKNPYPIYVKYLGDKYVLDEIKNISDPKISQGIIILDALDENKDASNDFDGFMTKLEEVTNKFRFVVITCRTHFFSKKEQELSNSTNWINGVQKGYLLYERIYISPFTEEETLRYIEDKYQLGSYNYTKAHKLIKSSHDLMTRPLILSFMDDLLKLENVNNLTTIDIYATIVDSWFDREKRFLPSTCSRLMFWDFSKRIAFYLYNKWNDYNEWFITEEEFQRFMVENGYDNLYSFKVRSLINRRNDGSIKFCHRCFWEFFLAIYVMENPGISFNPNGLDMAVSFVQDIYKSYLQGSTYDFINYYNPTFSVPYKVLDQDLYTELTEIKNNYDRIKSSKDSPENDRKINRLVYRYMEAMMKRLPDLKNPYGRLGKLLEWILKNDNDGFCLKPEEKENIENLNNDCYLEDITHVLLYSYLSDQSKRNTIIPEMHNLYLKYRDWEERVVYTIRKLKIEGVEPLLNNWLAFQDNTLEENNLLLPYLVDYSKEQIQNLILNPKIIHIAYGFNDDTSINHFIELIKKWIDKYCRETIGEKIYRIDVPNFIICIHKQSDDIDEIARFIKELPFISQRYIIKVMYNSKTVFYYQPNTTTLYAQSERLLLNTEEEIKAVLINMLIVSD